MDLSNITTILALFAGYTSFIEWRIRTMQSQMREKLEDRDRVNQVVQGKLEGDIARLEAKIDMLINLQIQGNSNEQKRQ